MVLRNTPVARADERQKIRGEWMKEVEQIKRQLDNNERLFNMTCDSDVTDYTIHERNALNTRFRYFCRLIRELDEQAAADRLPDAEPARAIEPSVS